MFLPAVMAGFLGACSASAPPTIADAPVGPNPEITAADLRARLFAYADDSMLGREAGTLGNYKATAYLAEQVAALGLEPAGEDGGFLQTVPLLTRAPDTSATLTAGGATLAFGSDWIPLPAFGGAPVKSHGALDGAQAVYGGVMGDPDAVLTSEQYTGRVVVLSPPPMQGGMTMAGIERYPEAAGIAVALLDMMPPQFIRFFTQPSTVLDTDADTPTEDLPLALFVTASAAEAFLGQPLDEAEVGAMGTTVTGTAAVDESPAEYPARNVVAILRGSDPDLRNEYIAIGAHNDHDGLTSQPVDHDSLWARLQVTRGPGAPSAGRRGAISDAQQTEIGTKIDSLRALRPARLDSVYNGADDDGSGTITVLEIAEAFALRQERPKRSILFVWHTAEEKGLYGAKYFTENPTVDRDAIVAALNLDMVGRGMAADIENGGPGYMQLIGSRRLSTELGDLVEAANTEGGHGFTFDYQYDADGHPENYYCRSDHVHYARWGIPVTFFSTGDHPDYHQLTDEPQYIAYDKMARVGQLVMDVADRVANLDHRVVVDKPKPDPYGQCQQ
jgi:hypothetical protein